MHARSSQEASHVLRRTRCSSKVCHHRRPRQDGPGRAGDHRLHKGARATARGARALPPARGGRGDLPVLALALRSVSAGRDRLPPGSCQAAASNRGRPTEKRRGGRAAPRADAAVGADSGGVPAAPRPTGPAAAAPAPSGRGSRGGSTPSCTSSASACRASSCCAGRRGRGCRRPRGLDSPSSSGRSSPRTWR